MSHWRPHKSFNLPLLHTHRMVLAICAAALLIHLNRRPSMTNKVHHTFNSQHHSHRSSHGLSLSLSVSLCHRVLRPFTTPTWRSEDAANTGDRSQSSLRRWEPTGTTTDAAVKRHVSESCRCFELNRGTSQARLAALRSLIKRTRGDEGEYIQSPVSYQQGEAFLFFSFF